MLQLYSHKPFTCPFHQRIWLASLELGLDFTYIAVDPWQKSAELLAVNPKGLVPCLVDGGKSVCDSRIIVEYLAEKYPKAGFFSTDPYERAQIHSACDFVYKNVELPFYRALWESNPDKKSAIIEQFSANLKFYFTTQKIENEIRSLNLLDCIIAPYILRIPIVFKHYLNFEIQRNENWERKFHDYHDFLLKNPNVRETIPENVEQIWIESYRRYAEGTVVGQLIDYFNGMANLP